MRATALFLPILMPLVAASCGGDSNNADAGGMPVGNVVMRDENSYTSQSSLTIPVVATASGADLQVCWGDLRQDILCHDVAPGADINNVRFLQFLTFTRAAIQDKLAKGTLSQNDVAVYRELHTTPSSTCASLSQFTFGQPLVPATDYVTAANKSYLLLFSTGTSLTAGARTMMFLDPGGSANTMVSAPNGCDILDFQANLTMATPLPIPINGPWVVDWSLITRDSMGTKVNFQLLDRLMVGFYEGMTVSDLEAMFKDVDVIATTLWDVAIPTGQKYMDLAQAKTAGGAAFSGFTGNGVYAVALLCSTCQVPAPIAFSILAPAP